jgi:hypothetical protein
MSLKLKKPSGQFPPGGWPFTDPRTKFTCNGFEGTPDMQAVKIIAHRRANPHIYPPAEGQWFDRQSVAQEVMAQKYATNPELFVGGGQPAPKPKRKKIEHPISMCQHCGSTDWEPVYCPTCGGKRLTGYKCKQCGKQ